MSVFINVTLDMKVDVSVPTGYSIVCDGFQKLGFNDQFRIQMSVTPHGLRA
jgi:hypothetical protein